MRQVPSLEMKSRLTSESISYRDEKRTQTGRVRVRVKVRVISYMDEKLTQTGSYYLYSVHVHPIHLHSIRGQDTLTLNLTLTPLYQP